MTGPAQSAVQVRGQAKIHGMPLPTCVGILLNLVLPASLGGSKVPEAETAAPDV